MNPDEIKRALSQTPAVIQTADGSTYRIENPEFAMVAKRSTAIMHRDENGDLTNSIIANHLIARITPAEAEVPPADAN